jgi:predicted nucleic acid-binding protein
LIVIDASALLEILPRTNRADRLMERAFAASERLHAPHLPDIEVTQALRRLVQRRQITAVRAQQVFDDLADLLI